MDQENKRHAHLIELPHFEHLVVCGVAEEQGTTRAECIENMVKHYLFLCGEKLNDLKSRE